MVSGLRSDFIPRWVWLSAILACHGLVWGEERAAQRPGPSSQTVANRLMDRIARPRSLTYTDTRIGDSRISYKDQEFLVDARLMVWQDGNEQIWVSRFDPVTGDLIPSDGRGRFIGVGAPLLTPDVFLQTVVNGPEFGYSQRGLGIYFCSGTDPANYQIARVDFLDGTQETLAPGQTNGVRGALATQDWLLPESRVLYGRLITNPDGTTGQISEWFDEGNPSTLEVFPRAANSSSGPRWVPQQPVIMTNVFDGDGIPQIATYNIETKLTDFLTAGPHSKIDGVPFNAPEYPGELWFVCTIDSRWVAIYRPSQPTWKCVRRIPAPGAWAEETPPGVSSVEPVFYRGQTFFTYVATYADGTSRICLAALDGRLNEWVSPPGTLRQLDPEGVPVGDNLFVYYWTARNESGVNELHRSQVTVSP